MRRDVTSMKVAKNLRQYALDRVENRYPTAPRVAPDGPTSMPIKREDPELRRLIDQALADRRAV